MSEKREKRNTYIQECFRSVTYSSRKTEYRGRFHQNILPIWVRARIAHKVRLGRGQGRNSTSDASAILYTPTFPILVHQYFLHHMCKKYDRFQQNLLRLRRFVRIRENKAKEKRQRVHIIHDDHVGSRIAVGKTVALVSRGPRLPCFFLYTFLFLFSSLFVSFAK